MWQGCTCNLLIQEVACIGKHIPHYQHIDAVPFDPRQWTVELI